MLKIKKPMRTVGLSIGLMISIITVKANHALAHTEEINNLSEFYDYYGADFTPEQQTIIQEIFGNIAPYFSDNGLENAVNDGFIPLTPEWKDHGIHWFNPTFVDLTNMQADPFKPSGLNLGLDGKLLGVFWAQELYDPLIPVFQELEQTIGIGNLSQEQLTQLYTNHTATTQTPTPDIFEVFPDPVWHQHKNVIIEGLGVRDVLGNLDPQQVDFRQSLLPEAFIGEIMASLGDPDSILVPLESDPSLSYPPFNRAVSGGFHMVHMWVGQGNHAGLFAGTNTDIFVTNNAIDEADTFEDGTNGHGHGMEGGHGHGGGSNAAAVPEPSTILGSLFLLFTGGMMKQKTKNKKTI